MTEKNFKIPKRNANKLSKTLNNQEDNDEYEVFYDPKESIYHDDEIDDFYDYLDSLRGEIVKSSTISQLFNPERVALLFARPHIGSGLAFNFPITWEDMNPSSDHESVGCFFEFYNQLEDKSLFNLLKPRVQLKFKNSSFTDLTYFVIEVNISLEELKKGREYFSKLAARVKKKSSLFSSSRYVEISEALYHYEHSTFFTDNHLIQKIDDKLLWTNFHQHALILNETFSMEEIIKDPQKRALFFMMIE